MDVRPILPRDYRSKFKAEALPLKDQVGGYRLSQHVLGCVIGLLFIALGHTDWQLQFAMAVTVLVSSYLIHIPATWRQAPITAAIVVAGGLQHHDKMTGMEQGLHRVGEVLFGCVFGIAVTWLLSNIWPLREPTATKV